MTSERWNQIQALFEAAVELPTEEQSAYLQEVCKDDPELQQEVEKLLEADGKLNSLLDGVVIDALGLPELVGPSQEGQVIGVFQIEKELGRGGMGTVYLASRIDGQFDQQVAIKLIRRGLADEELMRRFQSERQIQARLSHPAIARLLGGGLSNEGLPYFTMEYVEGLPLDQYCDQNKLDLEARIQLFLQVCEGVQYAHSRLVVHLDLKPGNVFVTKEERVKILDFGVAKAFTSDEEAKGSPATSRYLTPEYAAPEQVQRKEVGTPADVYSLGVVLYELLCGQRPYDLSDKSPAEVERILTQQAILPPSRRIAGKEDRALNRNSSPERLQKLLQGDLDNICDKALGKDTQRRYASVADLAEDLRRYLKGLPVKARPATLTYRIGKFYQRHRWAVWGSALALISLLVLAGFYTFRLREERDRAWQEAEKARQVSALLSGLFEGVDPEIANGDTLTARELMDRGAARIESELKGQPAVQAEMMDLIGVIYRKIGLPQQGASWLRKSLETQSKLEEADQERMAQTLHNLGEVYHFMENWKTADSLLSLSYAMRNALLSPPHPSLAESLDLLGQLRFSQRDIEEAISLHHQALAMRKELYGEKHPEVAESLQSLGATYTVDHTGEEAIYWLEEARKMREELGLRPLPSLYRSLGEAYNLLNDFAEAECYYQEALNLLTEIYGDQHPLIANYKRSLARLAVNSGQFERAIAYYEDALNIARNLYGPRHRAVARYLDELGTVYYDLRKPGRALPLAEEALEINLQFEPDRQRATLYSNIALYQEDLGMLKEAEENYRKSYYMDTLFFPSTHPYLIADCNNIGDLLQDLGDLEAAEAWYRKGLAYAAASGNEDHWAVASAYLFLGRLLVQEKRLEEAKPILEKAMEIRMRVSPEGNPHIQTTKLAMAEYYTAVGEYSKAEPFALEAYNKILEKFDQDHPLTQKARKQVADMYDAWGKQETAQAYR